jgi:hypothetical protein
MIVGAYHAFCRGRLRSGFKLNGETAYDNSGCSVVPAGEVNRDGFADVIVGARARNMRREGRWYRSREAGRRERLLSQGL